MDLISLGIGIGAGALIVSKKARTVFSNAMQKAYDKAEKIAKEIETKTENNKGEGNV